MIQFSRGRLAIIIPLQADWVSSLSSPPASLEPATRLPLRGTSGQEESDEDKENHDNPWPRPLAQTWHGKMR